MTNKATAQIASLDRPYLPGRSVATRIGDRGYRDVPGNSQFKGVRRMSEVRRTTTWFPNELGGSMLESVVRASDYDAAQSELAVLREDLATLQRKHERTESALNGSMKALTRVDNMWKKRWLDKTGEPSTSLIVDDEFKALFEEIKDYRKRLTAAEQRNAELVELLRRLEAACDKRTRLTTSDAYALASQANGMRDALIELDDARKAARAALKPTESGASE